MRKRTRFLWAVSVCLLVILGTEKRLAAAPASEQGALQSTVPFELAVPASCYAAGRFVPALCDAIGAVKFGSTLSQATSSPDAMRQVLQVLAKAGGERLVVLSLGPAGSSLAAIQAAYEYTARVFRTIQNRILSEMRDDPAQAALLRQFALADARAVEAMIARVFAEHGAVVDATRDYLMANPQAPGIRFHCLLACQQLVAAAQGANVFDTNTTPAVAEAGSGGAADVVVPLAIAGGGGIAGYMLLKQYLPTFGSGGGCTPPDPNPAQVCFGGNAGGSACQTAIAEQDAFCRCSGFTGGFNVNTGGCQN